MFASLLVLLLTAATCFAQGRVGPELTSFEFQTQPAATHWANGYMRSFFTNRIDIGPTVFPREYLAVADCWLNDARRDGKSIQASTCRLLLKQQMDDEGYVMSQQHGATSHDHGWPFPHWIQVPGKGGFKGVTAGWHFYDNPKGWEICYRPARDYVPERFSEEATKRWHLNDLKGGGINQDRNAWALEPVGPTPVLTSPKGVHLDPFNCPYIQVRWKADCAGGYIEWLREGDADWSRERRVAFSADWLDGAGRSESTGMFHSIIPLYDHPLWNGKIVRIRFAFPGLKENRTLFVRSIFSHWDTRHLVNNAIYIKAAFEYFRWTGDKRFLESMMPRLRTAMRFMMNEGNGLKLNHIRCTWPGHDGRAGYTVHEDGTKTFHVGHGKGGNYWDLLPFGWDDMYTTTHYYAALLAMAQLEEADAAIRGGMIGSQPLSPAFLRKHAAQVKTATNAKFWDEANGRFVGAIDADGVPHDYGFTFVNLEAVHYGIAGEAHARRIMAWIDGERIVEGDTSTGSDIYRYRLAPRATTKRNIEWYSFAWTGPETLPFGGQVQDGGAVLGFSFYDVMSRIKTLGADKAWQRLMDIREWDEEVAAYGGYRKYYGDGKGGTSLQGGGTAGGIGIDFEFTESSMLSAVIPLGFMGLRPDGRVLNIEPNLPSACPQMTVRNLLYGGVAMDVSVSKDAVKITVHSAPTEPLPAVFKGSKFVIDRAGVLQK